MERPTILEHAGQLAETTRSRLLLALDGHELTVGELCSVLQLPQSTVSRHLKVLGDGSWVSSRRDGTSNLYRSAPLEEPAASLWRLVRQEMSKTADASQDRLRLDALLRERRSRSQAFFSETAGRWDRLRDELFGQRFDLEAVFGLLDSSWVVADLACGTGRTARALAPFVSRVIAVDGSSAMLDAARVRLEPHANVETLHGELENLPIEDQTVDAATLILALHHVPDPTAVLREAHRVLRNRGRFVALDMLPHGHEEYRQEMGHIWLGFEPAQVAEAFADAGFVDFRLHTLRPTPAAKGPGLFVACAAAGHAAPSESIH